MRCRTARLTASRPAPRNLPRGGPIAFEFNSGTATTLGAVELQLNALNPSDGGTVNVFLVPNNAGSPSFTGTGKSLAFSGATLRGSISDSEDPLAAGPANQGSTLALNLATVATLTADTEYWIGLTDTVGSGTDATADFVFDLTSFTGGTGTLNQNDFFQVAITCPGSGLVICGTPGRRRLARWVPGRPVRTSSKRKSSLPMYRSPQVSRYWASVWLAWA